MCLLCSLYTGLVLAGLVILRSQIVSNPGLGRTYGKLRQSRGIGTHVGNQSGLVQMLRYGHGLADRESALAGGLLLKGRGSKRRSRTFGNLFLLHRTYGKHAAPAALKESLGLLLRVKPAVQHSYDLIGGTPAAFQFLRDKHALYPEIGFGIKCVDLPLPLHYQAEGHRLHAAGRERRLYLLPENGRELKAHQTVQHPAGLLGHHQIHVHVPGGLYGIENSVLGNLMEDYTAGAGRIQSQGLLQMPRYGLSLTVLIGCQPYHRSLVGGRLQIGHDFFLVRRHLVLRSEAVLDVYT